LAGKLKIKKIGNNRYGYSEIYSISGERVYENKLIDKSRININSEGFIPGIYFVKTLGDNATKYLNKIVIE
jgi:hypothetical protein